MLMRDSRIDFYKGILMWCVVYGHTINALLGGSVHVPIWLHTFVRTFDMPFFMILSGYFLKKSLERRGWWKVVLNRIYMIFFPTVIWTMLCCRVSFSMYYFLWSVLASSAICLVGNKMSTWLPSRVSGAAEFCVYGVVLVLLHVVKVPWNLFYLFPFFAIGYYMHDARFQLTRRAYYIVAACFVVLLCFWENSYTPWKLGALAWKDNPMAIFIYHYRFVLGIMGVYVMARIFDGVRMLLDDNCSLVRTVTEWGKETLALYILQSIVVERLLAMAIAVASGHYAVVLPTVIVNFVGYVAAPLLSFIFMVGLMFLIRNLKGLGMCKYAFGFRAS